MASASFTRVTADYVRFKLTGGNTAYYYTFQHKSGNSWVSDVSNQTGKTSYSFDIYTGSAGVYCRIVQASRSGGSVTYFPSSSGQYVGVYVTYKVRLVKYVDNEYQTETFFTTTSQIMSETAVKNQIPSSWASSDIKLKDPWFGTLSGCRYDQNEGEFTFTSTSPTINVAYTKIVVPTYNYYLRYHANGGTGGPDTQSTLKTTATSVTFRVPSTEPTRTNYTFLGWSFDYTATAADYVSGDIVYLYSGNPDRTLYAVWKKFYTYSYLYNANTTDTVTNMPENQSASSSETTYSFDIRGNVPTRTGYVFNGWALVSSGGGSIYSPNDPGPQLNTNKTSITLYAQWSPRTYTITVDYYDDTSKSGLSISGGGSYQYGSVATITATSRTGYTFDGWYTYISGVWTRVSANQNYDVTVTGAMTYYAKANKIAPTIPTATIEITGATSSSLSVKATLTNVLTFSDRWYLCISATEVFEAGAYTAIEASEQPFSYTFTGLSANTTYYFKVVNFYNGQYGWQVQATTGTTLRNTFSWDFNNNLDNRRPTAKEWLRLITFIEQKFGKTVSQEAKNSVVIGGTLSASLFNELAIDIGYASTVGRGTSISRAILYNLQNEVNR